MVSPAEDSRKDLLLLVGLVVLAVLVTAVVLAQQGRPGARTAAVGAPQEPPVVAFLGDGATAGQGASGPGARWTALVSAELGWVEVNHGVPGTGYAADGALPGQEAYTARVAQVVAGGPDVVVVSGGRNDDTSSDGYADSVRQVFLELRQGLPRGRLVAVSPVWDDDVPPEELEELGQVVRSQVQDVGGTYLDVGQPLQGRPDLVGADGVQMDDAGHAVVASEVQEAMAEAGLLPITAP
jgi:lysophospholipase L1-like esterase